MFESVDQLQQELSSLTDTHYRILDEERLRNKTIDALITTAVFSPDHSLRKIAQGGIVSLSSAYGCPPSSIFPLYQAIGKGEVEGFTVPAVNIRTLTYDIARLIFRLMLRHEIGAVVFEIARSEIEYTDQPPAEYTASVLAAAIKEGYKGPVFLQGDHYQFSKTSFTKDREEEISRLKQLINESIEGHFYNIDIDASTLVDLSYEDLAKQQQTNIEMTALLTQYIRDIQPTNIPVSIGGEIGHIGGKNSTVDDLRAFMKGYTDLIPTDGLSKISVQTGSSHGGIPLPDGSIQSVAIDFEALKEISTVARTEFSLGGAVQHGASTLPLSFFDKFVAAQTVEIHLATGLQNIVFDHLPHDLQKEIFNWTKETYKGEWDDTWNETQFLYKTRKKALGPFKQVFWELSPDEKKEIMKHLENHLLTIFEKLHCYHTSQVVKQLF